MRLENHQGVKGTTRISYSFTSNLIFKLLTSIFLESRRRNKRQRIGIGRLALPSDFPSVVVMLIIYFVFQLHVQGKTDEAKADLSRLAKIRAEREAAQAKRKAEAEGKHYTLLPSAITLASGSDSVIFDSIL